MRRWIKRKITALLTIMLFSINAAAFGVNNDICILCEDFNKVDSAVCPKAIKDCGGCIKGTKPVSWDIACIPINLEILENPKSATGIIGKSVILNCGFNHEADCEWFRQGSSVNVQQGGRYKYLSKQNGLPTKDCSLEINPFQKEDYGFWECHAYTEFDSVKSSKAWLNSSNEILITNHPQHAIVQYKKKVTLHCTFNLPVQCEWLHKGRPVRMRAGTYQYAEKTDNTKRENCSLTITSFRKKDEGEWQCQNAPMGANARVTSHKAVLYGGKPRKGNCVEKGEKVILHCYINRTGPCSWSRKKTVVDIKNRYKYVINTNDEDRTDCSIVISKIAPIDAEEWQCEIKANDSAEGSFVTTQSPCIVPGSLPAKMKKKKRGKRSISMGDTEPFTPSLPTVMEQPFSNLFYNSGSNFTLPCKFNKEISNCFWLRNEHNVDIAHRYLYVNGKNGHDTTDCSIKILQFQKTDLGSWICGSAADDEHDGVMSDPSYLDFPSRTMRNKEPDIATDQTQDDKIMEKVLQTVWLQTTRSRSMYLAIAAYVETMAIVILLVVILVCWLTKSTRQYKTVLKTTKDYTAVDVKEAEKMSEETGSKINLIQK